MPAPHKDIVSKDLLKRLVLDMAHYLFELPLRDAVILDQEQQCIEDRRADLVVGVTEPDGTESILHIEIQNSHDPDMPWRMMRYYTDIARAHRGKLVRQYLLYIGKEPLRMSHRMENAEFDYHYHLINARELDCERFLEQDTPDALIFAILCDFKGRDARDMVTHILKRLQALTKEEESRYRKCLIMLDVLASNRGLQPLIEEVEPMLNLNIEETAFYRIGVKKGISQGLEKGLEKGREKGMEEGIVKGQAILVRRLLDRFEPAEVAEISGVDLETVQRLRGDMRSLL